MDETSALATIVTFIHFISKHIHMTRESYFIPAQKYCQSDRWNHLAGNFQCPAKEWQHLKALANCLKMLIGTQMISCLLEQLNGPQVNKAHI